MDNIGDKLKAFFKEKGFTQDYIAEQLNTSQPYVGGLFSGKKKFGKKQAYKWSELFGLSPNWLLTGQGNMLLSDNEVFTINSSTETVSMSREVFDQITRLTETVISQQRTIEMMQEERKKMLVRAEDVAISAAANG